MLDKNELKQMEARRIHLENQIRDLRVTCVLKLLVTRKKEITEAERIRLFPHEEKLCTEIRREYRRNTVIDSALDEMEHILDMTTTL